MQKWTCIVSQLGLTHQNYKLNKSLFIGLQEKGQITTVTTMAYLV